MKLFIIALVAITTQSSFAGIYSHIIWDKKNVEVCFAPGEEGKRDYGYKLKVRDWSEKDKANVEKWANAEYKEERTGIHFVGWQSCSDAPYADVILFYNKNTKLFGNLGGLASVGPTWKIDNYPHAKAFAAISTSGMNAYVVLHELGHVAGLQHEHAHPEASSSCSLGKKEDFKNVAYDPYDKDSIMSYCNRNQKVIKQTEVDLLRRLYP